MKVFKLDTRNQQRLEKWSWFGAGIGAGKKQELYLDKHMETVSSKAPLKYIIIYICAFRPVTSRDARHVISVMSVIPHVETHFFSWSDGAYHRQARYNKQMLAIVAFQASSMIRACQLLVCFFARRTRGGAS